MPQDAQLVELRLRVRDLARALEFYGDLLGLQPEGQDAAGVRLVPAGRGFALELEHVSEASPRPQGSVGLYHFALLLPDRAALAQVVRRLVDAEWPLEGASDHGVSEAFYLSDPEGNGLELYRDRPRELWPWRGGELRMVTKALDVAALLREARSPAPLHAGTRLGHVHLSVADLEQAEAFYAGVLGLAVTQRSYPGALFFAAGDYHHHVGANVWGTRRPAPEGSTGLVRYVWSTPPGTAASLAGDLHERGVPHRHADGQVRLVDPAGVEVVVRDRTTGPERAARTTGVPP
ncbi:MAG: VOC family protein [Armatimonadota bacterium]|nr:VOC family protein [Armatimonadota bacterium]MDR7593723.1 VOC family protein [Armatimonadota bacterium]